MGQSIRLFTIRGIAIRMHITFPLILIWAALQFGVLSGRGGAGALFGVVAILLLFGIVLLHELGHSLTAQYYGVTVKQIVLLPIGGVAQLARIPEKPSQEFFIAVAGPAVNFGLAIVMGVIGLLAGADLQLSRLGAMLLGPRGLNLQSLFSYMFASNLVLGVFNLLPAFPMDGGRILRALLATRLSYPRATIVAVAIGQGLAVVLGFQGFLQGDFFILLVAIFIYAGAGQERQMVIYRSVLGGLTVEQAYSREARDLAPDVPLREAVELTLNTFQSDFPVCDGDKLVGLLTHTQLIKALDKFGPEVAIEQVMQTDIMPVTPDDRLTLVQERLAEGKVDALPVVRGDRFMGLITSRDISEVYRLVSIRSDVVSSSRQEIIGADPAEHV